MMTSSRLRGTGESFSNRRGHGSQLSISDPSHHVTEAIGTLYGDSDDDSGHEHRRDSRPLSFVASPHGGEQIQKPLLHHLPPELPKMAQPNDSSRLDERRIISRTMSDMTSTTAAAAATTDFVSTNSSTGLKKSQTLPVRKLSEKGNRPYESLLPPLQPSSPLSPTLSLREVQSEPQGTSQFPLTNIDNPNDIAQELSNLQALRRMSMDVGNSADPDLVPFQGLSLMAMPTIAPSGEDDEGDISRLLWVPAKVHPELAPDQFKTFLEKRVQSIKRRSGDSLLATDGQQPRVDGGELGRKKSMLSRQVEDRHSDGYINSNDGFDEKTGTDWHPQRSFSQSDPAQAAPELSLNELVRDPSKIVQRLALDTQRQTEGLETSSLDDDKPILPAPTMGLRRSTRTTYRKGGSLRSGDRAHFSKRALGGRQLNKDDEKNVEEPAHSSRIWGPNSPPERSLQRANSEPVMPENFSRPARSPMRRHEPLIQDSPKMDDTFVKRQMSSAPEESLTIASKSSSSGTSSAQVEATPAQPTFLFPQRSSSQSNTHQDLNQARLSSSGMQSPHTDDSQLQNYQQQQPQHPQQPLPAKSSKRPSFGRPTQIASSPPVVPVADAVSSQTLNEMVHHPSALPGGGSSRTDSLTFIPTFAVDDKRTDKKSKDKDDTDSGKSMSWKWFKSEDREKKKKEKEKEREKDRDDHVKKLRVKNDRAQPEKAHDGARLDVLQNSIDNSSSKGRESLVFDRDGTSAKTHEEKKPDGGNRKVGETKKEKDGFFGSIFGGSRRKESKEGGGGKGKHRVSSPEPTLQLLRPDIDYPYTRFPIVEERAIYRMAHIKLANPRRDLRSQVLLSNFMYSYLAKVQAMHPQLNVPTSPHQKRQEEERKRREHELQQQQYVEQQMLMQQQQQSQAGIDQYNFEYHRSIDQYGDPAQQATSDGTIDYIDDAQIFEYDHGGHQNSASISNQPQQHAPQHQQALHSQHEERVDAYGGDDQNRTTRGYYDYGHTDNGHNEDDMW